MKKYLLLIVIFLISANHCFASFSYYIPITIQASKVGGTVATPANFPVDVDVTQSTLMATSSGGHSQITNGWDIYFYSTSDCATTRLPAERETYTASTGQYTGWVQVGSLSTTTNTVIYACYGNTGVSSDPNSDGTYGKTKVWDSNFVAVYHLAGGATTDSTSNAFNLTPTAITASSTVIDGGGNFTGSSLATKTGRVFRISPPPQAVEHSRLLIGFIQLQLSGDSISDVLWRWLWMGFTKKIISKIICRVAAAR